MNWAIPCNTKYYDVTEAFASLKKLDWKQSNKNICVGDIVYIYVGKPIGAIKYKCKVNKVNISECEIDDTAFVRNGTVFQNYGNYMELELLQEYNDEEFTIEKLHALGLKGCIQAARKLQIDLELLSK